MRVKCPYCDKGFAVYPIPVRQALQHRRAGLIACFSTVVLMAVVLTLVGPYVIDDFVTALVDQLRRRGGVAVSVALMCAPFIFLALAIYDRMVPHFGRPVGDDLHCIKCGYILKGLREPRCPECGQAI